MKNAVTKKAFLQYLDTGKASSLTIKIIAKKIIRAEKLTQEESTIFFGLTAQVNQMILELSQKENFC